MAHAAAPIFCLVHQVTEPLQLMTSKGPYFLSTTQVYNPDNTQAFFAIIEVGSVIELITVNMQTYGVLRRHFRRREIREFSLKVPDCFTHFSNLPVSHPYSVVFLALLERSVLVNNSSLLESFLSKNPGQYAQYYAKTLKESFTLQTFDWIVDTIKTKNESEIINNEMLEMQTRFYAGCSTNFPYKELSEKRDRVPLETWVYHALATLFNVIFELVTVSVQGQPTIKYFYPNTSSTICSKLTITTDAWLYRKELVHTFTSTDKWVELLLSTNLFPYITEAYERRMEFKRLKNIEELMQMRKIAAALEWTDKSSIATIEAAPSLYDEILMEVYTRATSLKSVVELLELRTHCMIKACKNAAAHFLECDHGICSNCLIKDAMPTNLLHCEPCRRVYSDWKMFPPLSTMEKIQADAVMKRRVCSQCKTDMKTAKYPLPKVYKNRVYPLECSDPICLNCLELCVRDGSGVCPSCGFYVDIHESEIMEMTCKCVGCGETKPLIKEFPTVACSSHRFCVECVSKMKHIKKCKKCRRDFSANEQSTYSMFSALVCVKCKNPVRRAQLILNENEECECVLCQKCLVSAQRGSVNLFNCPVCDREHVGEEIILQSYANAVNSIENAEFPDYKKFFEEREKWRNTFKTCPICYGEIISEITKVYSGRCLHEFHRECFKATIEEDIKSIIKNNLQREVRCPTAKCSSEASTVYLTGGLALVEPAIYDDYNVYTAMRTHKEFICGNCAKKDYIEKELTHFMCEKCRQDQCTNCKGAWTPNHDQKACQFYTVEQAIRERFPQNCECGGAGCGRCIYSQCPGCKLPYLKDEHCDHVTCMNPECKVVFCFQCACYRLPTLEHCNTWHRRQCPNFPKDETQKVSDKIVQGERFRDKCTECKRLGTRCNPPPNLKKIRRFDLDEY